MTNMVLILFSLLLLSPLTLSLPTQNPNPNPTLDLIRKTCNTTTYYDLCVASLSSDPTSSSADVRGLSAICITAAIANATNTASYASALASKAADAAPKALLQTCAARYADARDALRRSLDSLAAEEYDYAFMHVSAAAEYPDVCRVLFRRQPRVVYPAAMARREAVLEHLCTIALEIISLLE